MRTFSLFSIRTVFILVASLSFTKVGAQDISDEAAFKEMMGYAYSKDTSDLLIGHYAHSFANNSVNMIETLAKRKLSENERKEVRMFYFNIAFEAFSHKKQIDFIYRTESEYQDIDEIKDALKLAKTPEGQKLIHVMNRLNFYGVYARAYMQETGSTGLDLDYGFKKFTKAFPQIKLLQ